MKFHRNSAILSKANISATKGHTLFLKTPGWIIIAGRCASDATVPSSKYLTKVGNQEVASLKVRPVSGPLSRSRCGADQDAGPSASADGFHPPDRKGDGNMLIHSSIAYQVDLLVVMVPNGAVFRLTLPTRPTPASLPSRPPPAVDIRTEVIERNLRRHRQAEESRIGFLAAPRRPYAPRWRSELGQSVAAVGVIPVNGRHHRANRTCALWWCQSTNCQSERSLDPTSAINLRRGARSATFRSEARARGDRALARLPTRAGRGPQGDDEAGSGNAQSLGRNVARPRDGRRRRLEPSSEPAFPSFPLESSSQSRGGSKGGGGS
jgi:hypothetical protein